MRGAGSQVRASVIFCDEPEDTDDIFQGMLNEKLSELQMDGHRVKDIKCSVVQKNDKSGYAYSGLIIFEVKIWKLRHPRSE